MLDGLNPTSSSKSANDTKKPERTAAEIKQQGFRDQDHLRWAKVLYKNKENERTKGYGGNLPNYTFSQYKPNATTKGIGFDNLAKNPDVKSCFKVEMLPKGKDFPSALDHHTIYLRKLNDGKVEAKYNNTAKVLNTLTDADQIGEASLRGDERIFFNEGADKPKVEGMKDRLNILAEGIEDRIFRTDKGEALKFPEATEDSLIIEANKHLDAVKRINKLCGLSFSHDDMILAIGEPAPGKFVSVLDEIHDEGKESGITVGTNKGSLHKLIGDGTYFLEQDKNYAFKVRGEEITCVSRNEFGPLTKFDDTKCFSAMFELHELKGDRSVIIDWPEPKYITDAKLLAACQEAEKRGLEIKFGDKVQAYLEADLTYRKIGPRKGNYIYVSDVLSPKEAEIRRGHFEKLRLQTVEARQAKDEKLKPLYEELQLVDFKTNNVKNKEEMEEVNKKHDEEFKKFENDLKALDDKDPQHKLNFIKEKLEKVKSDLEVVKEIEKQSKSEFDFYSEKIKSAKIDKEVDEESDRFRKNSSDRTQLEKTLGERRDSLNKYHTALDKLSKSIPAQDIRDPKAPQIQKDIGTLGAQIAERPNKDLNTKFNDAMQNRKEEIAKAGIKPT